MLTFNIPQFINEFITQRPESFFTQDIESNKEALSQKIRGKNILVIGGAGTIGSSFIKAILPFEPSSLVVVDYSENGLTELTRDLRSNEALSVPEEYKTYPLDFAHPVFEKILKREGPFHIVANFAAHKHVRSEKDQYSIEAMIDNNVFKAKRLLDLLVEHKPERFFCVSTDKAANPVNVMGASKKLMEEVIMSYANQLPITTARFANVAFSNGSLLFGYMERLLKKQPLSCPSDVKRYFVSPEESGQICMLACMLGGAGEIFFPKFEEEKLILFKTITDAFIPANGFELDEEKAKQLRKGSNKYPVYYFPTETSGEKLFEEFYTQTDVVDRESFRGLGVIKNATQNRQEEVDEMIASLKKLLQSDAYTKADIVAEMQKFIPNFAHIETGKSLDQKM